MPTIRSSTVLRNSYNEISTLCRESKKPVFITKNGQGDLAVMSIETYEMLLRQIELYEVVVHGMVAVQEGRRPPREDDFRAIMRELAELRVRR
ncbi:MAG: prevent-host-death protein [Syntrophomonas sp.]|nr:prevent-host-death protein [Syntrophomonas sp.]